MNPVIVRVHVVGGLNYSPLSAAILNSNISCSKAYLTEKPVILELIGWVAWLVRLACSWLVCSSETEHHKFDTLNKGDELAVLIKKAQGLGGYDLNVDISLETVRWQAIYHFSQIARTYEPLPLPINLFYFYAAERERSHLPQIDMVGGWRKLLPDLEVSSISIPGNHMSMMEDVSNRKHLATSTIVKAMIEQYAHL